MALGSRIIRQSPCVNTPVNPAEELNKLVGAQSPAKRSNAESNEAPIEASTPLETLTLTLIPPTSENLFIKFMKVFMETIQAQDQEQLEPQKRLFKARTPETYPRKSHMDCYHFCQEYEDYFKMSGAIGINRTPFAATFFHGFISLR